MQLFIEYHPYPLFNCNTSLNHCWAHNNPDHFVSSGKEEFKVIGELLEKNDLVLFCTNSKYSHPNVYNKE